jgi:Zn-dependent protease
MQTLHGIRFVPILRIRGTLLGVDTRWVGARGLIIVGLLLALAPGRNLLLGLATLGAVVATTLGHEMGHALAGRLAGLQVRAVVLGPDGGITIRSASDQPRVNFRTALAGPLANALLAGAFAALALCVAPGSSASSYLTQLGTLQLLVGMANLLPVGPLDGTKILEAWRACVNYGSPG